MKVSRIFKSGKLPKKIKIIGHLLVLILFGDTNCGVLIPVPAQDEYGKLAAHSQKC